MFGSRGITERYDRLNPRCAVVFHAMVDEMAKRTGQPRTSTSYFSSSAVTDQLDGDLVNGRKAVELHGDEQASENLCMQLAAGLNALAAANPGKDMFIGMAGAVPFLRRIVFGFAPGMAAAQGADAYGIALRTVWVLAHMLDGLQGGSVLQGSRKICFDFHNVCVELQGEP